MGTLDSAVGSGSLADSTSLNTEVRSSEASHAVVRMFVTLKNSTKLTLKFIEKAEVFAINTSIMQQIVSSAKVCLVVSKVT